jgi:large subunit ribosomal protein L2
LFSHGGRNFLGRVCVYHKGSGNKRRFKLIDRYRRLDQYGYVLKVFKGNFKSPFFGMLLYDNGLISLVALADGVFVGSRLFSGASLKGFIETGFSGLLRNFGLFSVISSFELFPWSGFKVSRGAGCSAFIVGNSKAKSIIKLSSGWQIKVPDSSMGVLGISSNVSHKFSNIGKAGKSRALGIRPTVRGVIKNPCDHPHGGGEGRGSPPAAAVSP